MASQKYTFDFEYQVDILKVALSDLDFLKLHSDVFQPHFFTLDHLMIPAQQIKEFYEQNRGTPNHAQFRHAIAVYYSTYPVRPDLQANINSVVDRVCAEKPQNADAIKATILDFAQRQSVLDGCQKVIDLIDKGGDLTEAVDIMRKSTAVGVRQRQGISFFTEVSNLHNLLLSDKGYSPKYRIPTGFTTIDRATYGGIGPGHIWVIAAKPKTGKTTLMVNVARTALYSGRKVFHYSFGDMNELDVMLKYAQCFSGFTVGQIMQGYNCADRCKQVTSISPGADLQVIYESPGVMDTNDLYTDIGFRISRTGISPDLIVVDYANKMKHPVRDSSYRSMSMIYEGLKAIGDTYNCGILTGVQLRRDAKRSDGQAEDVAESWLQIADCDAMIIINQDAADSSSDRVRLSVPIVRRGMSVPACEVEFDRATARFREV